MAGRWSESMHYAFHLSLLGGVFFPLHLQGAGLVTDLHPHLGNLLSVSHCNLNLSRMLARELLPLNCMNYV